MSARVVDDSETISCSVEETPPPGPATSSGSGAGSEQMRSEAIFGDSNLSFLMMVLVLLHLLQYSMRDPCTC
jgi:hypothetical protein